LSVDSRQVLQTASLLGDQASIERIQKVLELPSHRILAAVEELNRAVMLKSASGVLSEQHSDNLQPRHDLLCSAALKTVAAPMLTFLHRRAADVIESELSGTGTPIALLWACATHRDAGGDRNKALTVSLACAEHLLEVGLVAESVGAFQKSLEYCANDEQRLRVLPRLASAAQLNGAWDQTKDALRTCIRIASTADPAIAHNEFELTLFAVRLQSDLNSSPLLDDLMPCVTCGTASAEHRVRAAILALKIATDFGPPETLDTIFESVRPLLGDPQIQDAWRLELLTIYRTSRRHDAVPITELNSFADAAHVVGGELAYASALLTASSACRISGRYDEALQFIAKAYEIARGKKRWSVVYRLHFHETRVHIAAENYAEAARTLERAATFSVSPDHFTATDLLTYGVRLAIQRGDFLTAQKLFSELAPISSDFSRRRRAHTLALSLRIRLMSGVRSRGNEVRKLVDQLGIESAPIRALGGCDFEAYSLYLGLAAIGEEARARQMLADYVRQERQSDAPLPVAIRDALDQRDVKKPGTRNHEPLRNNDQLRRNELVAAARVLESSHVLAPSADHIPSVGSETGSG
jgi:tetratricopeptide (TPR) repeat protein